MWWEEITEDKRIEDENCEDKNNWMKNQAADEQNKFYAKQVETIWSTETFGMHICRDSIIYHSKVKQINPKSKWVEERITVNESMMWII